MLLCWIMFQDQVKRFCCKFIAAAKILHHHLMVKRSSEAKQCPYGSKLVFVNPGGQQRFFVICCPSLDQKMRLQLLSFIQFYLVAHQKIKLSSAALSPAFFVKHQFLLPTSRNNIESIYFFQNQSSLLPTIADVRRLMFYMSFLYTQLLWLSD